MNYIDIIKSRNLPEDLRYEIYSHYISDQVKQNHDNLLNQINGYLDDVKRLYKSWYNVWEYLPDSPNLTVQDAFDEIVINGWEGAHSQLWWITSSHGDVEKWKYKFMGFYNELGKGWWEYPEDDRGQGWK